MAGSEDASENPVAVNVVPMVDVIFCLCVFFMCSFKFRQVEGAFDAWLPKDRDGGAAAGDLLREIRVALLWDARAGTVVRRLGVRAVPQDAELGRLLAESLAAWRRAGVGEPPLVLDAAAEVPWREVVRVIDVARGAGIGRFEFAHGAPLGEKRRR